MENKSGGNELITTDVFGKLNIEDGMRVGDFGCGNLGYFSLPAAKLVGEDGMVFAVDILKSVLESVRSLANKEGLENVKTVWSNLEIVGATKIDLASLDVGFLVNILFQSQKDDLVIKEVYRLLKDGGKLVIIDWERKNAPFGPPVKDRTNKDEIKVFAKNAGFSLIEEFVAGPYHYGLIFNK